MLEIRHVEASFFRQAYDEIFQQKSLRLNDSFYLWILELLKPRFGSVLLDISCGEGRLVQLARQRFAVRRVIGIDFALQGILKGAQGEPQANWLVGDGEALPLPDNCVDYVTHIGSLEHYNDPLKGVQEISRVLKPSGIACVLLPNAFGLLGNILHVCRFGEIFDDGQPIQRYATRRTWETLLTCGGLTIERVVPYGEVNKPRTLDDLMWMCKKPQKIAKLFLVRLIPVNLANHFVFICRPTSKTG